MEAGEIEALGPALDGYLDEFGDCFGRVEPRAHFRTYVEGQLSDLPRKSVEPIALAAGTPPRTLQQFLSAAKWDAGRMRDRLQRVVARDHAHPRAIGTFDETGYPKKGGRTPGVKRQYCGATGKTDNCVVTVHLAYAAPDAADPSGGFRALLDGELFLPEDWAADRARCRAAGIPDDMVHRPKWRIALELVDRAAANGVRFPWLTFDEGYGRAPEFLHALDDRGQWYVGEVPCAFTGWRKAPPVLTGERPGRGGGGRMGRPRTFPRLADGAPAASSARDLFRHSPAFAGQAWQTFHVKDTTTGPAVWRAKAVAFYPKRDGLPARAHWLVVAQNVLDPDEAKYFVSNAPPGTPLEVILYVAFGRWPVERCFEDQKTELGMDHFEVRNYRAVMRHLTITAVTFLFLSRMRQGKRGEKAGPDGVPGPHRRRRPGAVPVDGRPAPAGIPAAAGRGHRLYPGPQPGSRRVPPQSRAVAA
jgi:SRSO17 transposase